MLLSADTLGAFNGEPQIDDGLEALFDWLELELTDDDTLNEELPVVGRALLGLRDDMGNLRLDDNGNPIADGVLDFTTLLSGLRGVLAQSFATEADFANAFDALTAPGANYTTFDAEGDFLGVIGGRRVFSLDLVAHFVERVQINLDLQADEFGEQINLATPFDPNDPSASSFRLETAFEMQLLFGLDAGGAFFIDSSASDEFSFDLSLVDLGVQTFDTSGRIGFLEVDVRSQPDQFGMVTAFDPHFAIGLLDGAAAGVVRTADLLADMDPFEDPADLAAVDLTGTAALTLQNVRTTGFAAIAPGKLVIAWSDVSDLTGWDVDRNTSDAAGLDLLNFTAFDGRSIVNGLQTFSDFLESIRAIGALGEDILRDPVTNELLPSGNLPFLAGGLGDFVDFVSGLRDAVDEAADVVAGFVDDHGTADTTDDVMGDPALQDFLDAVTAGVPGLQLTLDTLTVDEAAFTLSFTEFLFDDPAGDEDGDGTLNAGPDGVFGTDDDDPDFVARIDLGLLNFDLGLFEMDGLDFGVDANVPLVIPDEDMDGNPDVKVVFGFTFGVKLAPEAELATALELAPGESIGLADRFFFGVGTPIVSLEATLVVPERDAMGVPFGIAAHLGFLDLRLEAGVTGAPVVRLTPKVGITLEDPSAVTDPMSGRDDGKLDIRELFSAFADDTDPTIEDPTPLAERLTNIVDLTVEGTVEARFSVTNSVLDAGLFPDLRIGVVGDISALDNPFGDTPTDIFVFQDYDQLPNAPQGDDRIHVGTNLAELENLGDFSATDMIGLVANVARYLTELLAVDALNVEIPLIDVRVGEIVELADKFLQVAQALEDRDPQGLTQFNRFLGEALADLGLSPGILTIEITPDDLRIHLAGFAGQVERDLPINFAIGAGESLPLVGLDAGGLVQVRAGYDLHATFGVRFQDPDPGDADDSFFERLFIAEDPNQGIVNLFAELVGTDLSAGILLGPLSASLSGSLSGRIDLRVNPDDGTARDFVLLEDLFDDPAGNFTLDIGGPIRADFVADLPFLPNAPIVLRGNFSALLPEGGSLPSFDEIFDFSKTVDELRAITDLDALDQIFVAHDIQFGAGNLSIRQFVDGVLEAARFLGEGLQQAGALADLPVVGNVLGFGAFDVVIDGQVQTLTGIEFLGHQLVELANEVEDVLAGASTDEEFVNLLEGAVETLFENVADELGVAPTGDPDDPYGIRAAFTLEVLKQDGTPLTGNETVSVHGAAIILGLKLEGILFQDTFTIGDPDEPEIDFGPIFQLDLDADINVFFGYQLDLVLGIDLDTGFFLSSTDALAGNDGNFFELFARAEAPEIRAETRLGFLDFLIGGGPTGTGAPGTASIGGNLGPNNDAAGVFVGIKGFDPGDPASRDRIHFAELGNANSKLSDLVGFDFILETLVDLPLELAADFEFVPGLPFPKLLADLHLDWTVDGSELGTPNLALEDIRLDLGAFAKNVLAPMLEELNHYNPLAFEIGGSNPIKDFIDTEIPLIEQSFRELARAFSSINPSARVGFAIFEFLLDLPETIDELERAGTSEFFLDAGSFGILGDDTGYRDPVDANGNPLESYRAQFESSQIGGTTLGSDLEPAGVGRPLFEFPILKDPMALISLVLGKGVGDFEGETPTFIQVNPPPFTVGPSFRFDEELFSLNTGFLDGALRISLEAFLGLQVRFGFGFDAHGFETGNILDGLYVVDQYDAFGNDISEVALGGGISASVDGYFSVLFGAVSARLTGSGGLSAEIGLDLNDEAEILPAAGRGDGKFHLDEIARIQQVYAGFYESQGQDPILANINAVKCLFNLNANVNAYLSFGGKVKVWPGITLFNESFSADWQIFNESFGFCENPIVLAQNNGAGHVELNIGKFADRRNDGRGDVAEDYFVRQIGADTFEVTAFGLTQTISGSMIVGTGGELNDRIVIDSSVTVPVFITGGAGDDVLVGGSSSAASHSVTIDGGPGNDSITGGNRAAGDVLRGGTGRDTISGLAGDDMIFGSEDDDSLLGGLGLDTLRGGPGNDTLFGDAGADVLLGEEDSDSLVGGSEDDQLTGGTGNDVLRGQAGNDALTGSAGDDQLFGDSGFDELMGGAGLDLLRGGDDDDELSGGDGADAIFGEAGMDLVMGDAGDDTLSGGLARDTVRGGDDDDRISGDEGDDLLFGDAGADRVLGNEGSDEIHGGTEADILFGDNGIVELAGVLIRARTLDPGLGGGDSIFGDAGADVVFGGSGGDDIETGDGADIVLGDHGVIEFADPVGGFGNLVRLVGGGLALDGVSLIRTTDSNEGGDDIILGGSGSDVLLGGAGDDDVSGEADADVLLGDDGEVRVDARVVVVKAVESVVPLVTGAGVPLHGGRDTLRGAAGDDIALGGGGSDSITGGTGADVLLGDQGQVDLSNDLLLAVQSTEPATGAGDVILAGDGDDIAIGADGSDEIDGEGGDDILLGDHGQLLFAVAHDRGIPATRGGSDSIDGGGEADVVVGGTGSGATPGGVSQVRTTEVAEGGNDVLLGGDGDDLVLGGSGSDSITGGVGADVLLGDQGQIDLVAGLLLAVQSTEPTTGASDVILAGAGRDIAIGADGSDEIDGAEGDDVLLGDHGRLVFAAGALAQIRTTPESTVGGNTGAGGVRSGSGDVAPLGNALGLLPAGTSGGADTIRAGAGDDIALGGALGDDIAGDDGRDILVGDEGAVTLVAGAATFVTTDEPGAGGSDTIRGGFAGDTILGGAAADQLFGDEGDDLLLGDQALVDLSAPRTQNWRSIDTAAGFGADDRIEGNAGDDTILGQQGADRLFGDADQDDITGGHNVIGGADGDDVIDGGSEADVILGDNGIIQRRLGAGGGFERYPDPFPDVIRDVTRFDDADGIGGDDVIFGQGGMDIVHGQRGDDMLDGGDDDDELIGELGQDSLLGGSGNDFLLSEVGYLLRRFDGGAPALKANGTWHRDVILEEVGVALGIRDIDSSGSSIDPDLVAELLLADLIVLTGAFNADGTQHLNANGAWDTDMLMIDLFQASMGFLEGGAGDDVLFGQRGANDLAGGDGNDLIFGDRVTNLTPFAGELPQVYNDVRVIGAAAGAGLPFGIATLGTTIAAPFALGPEEGDLNAPFVFPPPIGTIFSGLTLDFAAFLGIEALERGDGTVLRPYASIVPDVAHHLDAMAGNDTIRGGAGDDFIVGDDATAYSPLISGVGEFEDILVDASAGPGGRDVLRLSLSDDDSPSGIQRALDDVWEVVDAMLMHLRKLAIDFDHLEHDVLGRASAHDLRFGEDVIDAGEGDDMVFGDDARIVVDFQLGIPIDRGALSQAVLDLHAYLRDLEYLAVDFDFTVFTAHHDVLGRLIEAGVKDGGDHDHHDLFIGNDEIDGGAGNDLISGDHGALFVPFLSGIEFDDVGDDDDLLETLDDILEDERDARRALLFSHVEAHHDVRRFRHDEDVLEALVQDFEYELAIGNDAIHGGDGNDLIVGDFGSFAFIVVPGTDIDDETEDRIEDLLEDIEDWVEVEYDRNEQDDHDDNHDFAPCFEDYLFREEEELEVRVVAGNDTLVGGAGDDFMVGDSTSIAQVFLPGLPDWRGDLGDELAFELDDMAREDDEFDELYEDDDDVSDISNDTIVGGEGNDILFAQEGDDLVMGGFGDDRLFGDDDDDTLVGGPGDDDKEDDEGGPEDEEEELEVARNLLFDAMEPWGVRLASDVAASTAESPEGVVFDPVLGNFVETGAPGPTSSARGDLRNDRLAQSNGTGSSGVPADAGPFGASFVQTDARDGAPEHEPGGDRPVGEDPPPFVFDEVSGRLRAIEDDVDGAATNGRAVVVEFDAPAATPGIGVEAGAVAFLESASSRLDEDAPDFGLEDLVRLEVAGRESEQEYGAENGRTERGTTLASSVDGQALATEVAARGAQGNTPDGDWGILRRHGRGFRPGGPVGFDPLA